MNGMSLSRYFDIALLLALIGLGTIGISRAIRFHRRGIHVVSADRQRSLGQVIADTSAGICLLVWGYEVIVYGFAVPLHIGPAEAHAELIPSPIFKVVGVLLAFAAVLLYGFGLKHLGEAWRLGVDREKAGPLVTSGIYAWTRHPIYVAFDLIFIGTFFVHSGWLFLLLVVVWLPLMHRTMIREELFLKDRFGDEYADYCKRVGRYIRLSSS